MSKYGEYITELRDEKHLCAALTQMGFKFEVHQEPQTLYGYHGDAREEKANIIIRRRDTGIGASNDVGFIREPDGRYRAVISQYDRSAKFNDAWLGKMKQTYQEVKQMAVAKAKGYHFLGREQQAGGKVVLRFGVLR